MEGYGCFPVGWWAAATVFSGSLTGLVVAVCPPGWPLSTSHKPAPAFARQGLALAAILPR